MKILFLLYVLSQFCFLACAKIISVKESCELPDFYRELIVQWDNLAQKIKNTADAEIVLSEVKNTVIQCRDLYAKISGSKKPLLINNSPDVQQIIDEWEARTGTAKMKASMEINVKLKNFKAGEKEFSLLMEAGELIKSVPKSEIPLVRK